MESLPQSTPSWLTNYLERGFRLLFYQTKQKGPSGSAAVGWTTRADSADDYNDGDNVGTFTGHEIRPGQYLVDVDFDWPEGLAMARRIFNKVKGGFGFGRASRLLSHVLFTTSEPQASKEYTNIDGKGFVELRGTKQDGSIGLQTMLPPSVHPSGEVLVFRSDGEITHDDAVPRKVLLYAVACILYAHLGQRGLLHEARLAVAGFLLGEGLREDEVISICEAVAEASGNNVADVATAVQSTAARIRQGERPTGKGTLAKAIGPDGKAVVARISSWLGVSDFLTDAKDRILANHQENIRRALERLDVSLSFDVFSQKPIITYLDHDGTLHDVVVNRIRLEIETRFHFLPNKEHFFDVVQDLAHKNPFHPVLDYLNGLTWDGIPRLDRWLIEAANAADTEYVRNVSSLVPIAAVLRVMKPGCKFDEMIVLESGTQGLLKSTALRKLCPNEAWFSDDLPLNVEAKEIIERTQGKWLLEASEMSGMSPAKVEHLKAMLARQVDGPVRMAYARLAVEQPRQFVVVGTTNSYSYLHDSTGNRRFWPVRVEKFDIEWIAANRDQLWAEATHRARAGASIRLPEALYRAAELQQERRRLGDEWEPILSVAFEADYQRVASDEIWEHLGIPIERRDDRAQKRVSQVMQRLRFVRKTVHDRKGKRVWGWARGAKLTDSDDDDGKDGKGGD